MPQTTISVPLTTAWTQLSTGAESYTVSVQSGSVFLSDSTVAPTATSSGHLVQQYDQPWLITPPSVVYARSNGPSAILIKSGG